MKVLYLHQYFETNKSSGGTRSYEFSKHLAKKGYEVNIVTGNEVENEEIHENIKVYSTKLNTLIKWDLLRELCHFLIMYINL